MSNGHNSNATVETSFLGEAWEILKNKAGLIIAYSLITTVISFVLSLLWETVFQLAPETPATTTDELMEQIVPQLGSSLIVNLLNQVVYSALLAGFIIFCIKEIRTKDATFNDFFSGFDYFIPAFVVVFLTSVVTTLGMFACCIGLFFAAGLSMFALPLVVDRKLGPWEAFKESWRVLGAHWGQVGLYYFLAFLITISGALACGIGIIWTAPFVSIASAVLYTKFYDTPSYGTGESHYVRETQDGSMPKPPEDFKSPNDTPQPPTG